MKPDGAPRWCLTLLPALLIGLQPVCGAASTLVPASPCKMEIARVLSSLETLPNHEEESKSVTETRADVTAPFAVVATKRTLVRRVQPDRLYFGLWKQDKLRLESVSIGAQTWDREPGESWKVEPPAKPGSITKAEQNLPDKIAQLDKEWRLIIDDEQCHGIVDDQGRKAIRYTYRIMVSQVELWVDATTQHPLREHASTRLNSLRSRNTTSKVFRYDDKLRVEPPEG